MVMLRMLANGSVTRRRVSSFCRRVFVILSFFSGSLTINEVIGFKVSGFGVCGMGYGLRSFL